MSDLTRSTAKRGPVQVVAPVLILLAIMWLSELIDWLLPINLDYLGIQSRTAEGLIGVVAAPFLHANFDHLIANTFPFLILGTLVSWRAGKNFWSVTIVIVLVSGSALWLLGPSNVVTIGASGLVFGFLGYLLAAGIITRHWADVLISLVVLLAYGSLLLGALPFGVSAQISWQMHLFGGLAGVLAATMFAEQSRSTKKLSAD